MCNFLKRKRPCPGCSQFKSQWHPLHERTWKGKVQCQSNGRNKQFSRKQGCESHKMHFPRKVFQPRLCDLEGQIGFADASWTCDGHQSLLLLQKERADLGYLL